MSGKYVPRVLPVHKENITDIEVDAGKSLCHPLHKRTHERVNSEVMTVITACRLEVLIEVFPYIMKPAASTKAANHIQAQCS